jgi:hypothetical protein
MRLLTSKQQPARTDRAHAVVRQPDRNIGRGNAARWYIYPVVVGPQPDWSAFHGSTPADPGQPRDPTPHGGRVVRCNWALVPCHSMQDCAQNSMPVCACVRSYMSWHSYVASPLFGWRPPTVARRMVLGAELQHENRGGWFTGARLQHHEQRGE